MKKIITINLDKERHLKYDLNALEIIENITEKSIEEATKKMDMKTFKALVYAGLKWEDKKLTLERVGELITFDNMKEVSEALGRCFGNLQKSSN